MGHIPNDTPNLFACTKCNAPETVPITGGVKREWRCRACGHIFTTFDAIHKRLTSLGKAMKVGR